MKPAPFDYVLARSAAEAVEVLARHGGEAKVLAGGQSLVPMLNMRLARPAVLVDINGAGDLDYLREADGSLAVGALVRQSMFERWTAARLPLIAEALRWAGHAAIRNRGTVAGSVAHADPASELPALLLCCGGTVVARRVGGERVIPAAELYLGPLTTSLGPDEIVTEVRFPLPRPGAGWGFAEVARRHGDFALVGVAAGLTLDDGGVCTDAALALTGVGPTPVRAEEAAGALVGARPTPAAFQEASRKVSERLRPDSDLHASAEYRKHVGGVLTRRALARALERATGERR